MKQLTQAGIKQPQAERVWATAFKYVCKKHNVPEQEINKILAVAKRVVIGENRNRDNFR